jgi:ubiquinol-cytochrome c reductase cytochrome b subunit
MYKIAFWVLVADVLVLGWVGKSPAEEPYVRIGQFCAAYYFFHFLILVPLIAKFEKPLPLPNSITEAVLGHDPEAAPAVA